MNYLYESHMGGYYDTDEYIGFPYCESCGDTDTPIGSYETKEEREQLIKEYERRYK